MALLVWFVNGKIMGRVTDCLQSFGQDKKVLAAQLMRLVAEEPACLAELLACLGHSDIAIQKHAAELLKKIGLKNSQWMQPYKAQLLEAFSGTTVPQVQWHLCYLLSCLDIDQKEFEKLRPTLLDLHTNSPRRAVNADALATTVELSRRLGVYVAESRDLLRDALNSKIPAVSARARLIAGSAVPKNRLTWWQ